MCSIAGFVSPAWNLRNCSRTTASHQMDEKGCWRDNVFVARLWKSIKYEEVYLRTYVQLERGLTGRPLAATWLCDAQSADTRLHGSGGC